MLVQEGATLESLESDIWMPLPPGKCMDEAVVKNPRRSTAGRMSTFLTRLISVRASSRYL